MRLFLHTNKRLEKGLTYFSDKFLHNLDHMLVELTKKIKQASEVRLIYCHVKKIIIWLVFWKSRDDSNYE